MTGNDVPAWFKCRGCGRVRRGEEQAQDGRCVICAASPESSEEERAAHRAHVKAHRDRTGNAYGKKYEAAKRRALKRLAELHPEDFRRLMGEERAVEGLAPASR